MVVPNFELMSHKLRGSYHQKGPDYGVESPITRLKLFPLTSPSLLVSTLQSVLVLFDHSRFSKLAE